MVTKGWQDHWGWCSPVVAVHALMVTPAYMFRILAGQVLDQNPPIPDKLSVLPETSQTLLGQLIRQPPHASLMI